jgi:NAD+ kinase
MSVQIRRVGIVAKRGLKAASEHLASLEAWLRAHTIVPVYEQHTAMLAGADGRVEARAHDDLPADVDLIVVLGGDGTLLSAATCIARAGRDIPILGVNFGSLGFLTETRIDELYTSLDSVIHGTAAFDGRTMLDAQGVRDGAVFDARIVLNDVVFTKAALSRMIELSVSVSGGFVTKVKADGLIIATATGSTAYNLAAGGPIVHPTVDALVLTPIAPHTLTNRPVVIPGSAEVEVRPHVLGNEDQIFVTFDGQSGYALREGDLLRVRKSAHTLRLVKAPARSYFELLREKLKWGERGGRE